MKKRARKQKRNDMLPLLLIGVGVALVVGVLVWQATRSVQTAIPSTAAQTANTERITLAQAKAAFDNNEAVFLDVRDSGSFAAGHIPGSVNIPLALLENRANELDPNQWIITYCT